LEVTLPRRHTHAFSQSLIIGAAAKEILRSLLEASHYKVYPFGYESSLSSLKMQIWDSHFQDSNEVERVRSMPDYVVSSEKGLKLVEVKFRKRSDREGHPGVYMKNTDLHRYRRYWAESVIALISPFADHFFCQDVNNLVPGSQETKWFDYNEFRSLMRSIQKRKTSSRRSELQWTNSALYGMNMNESHWKNDAFGFGLVLAILGLFLFGIAFSSYQDSNANYQACLTRYFLTYCNSNAPVVSWGPLEIVGGALTAIGLGLVAAPILGRLEGKKVTSPS